MLCLHGKGILLFFLSVNGECEGKGVPLLTVGRERGGGGRTDLRRVGEGGGRGRTGANFDLPSEMAHSFFFPFLSVRPSEATRKSQTDRPNRGERGGEGRML